MALRRLVRCCRSLLHEHKQAKNWIESRTGAKRYLLSEDVIRLQNLQEAKLQLAHFSDETKENFIRMFNRKLKNNELILRHELKQLLHLCQSPDDMVTAQNAIYRYHEENRNFAHGEYKFGPIFMRLCYEFSLETMGIATLTDENMRGFFNDVTSFNIGIDMLFTKDALEVLQTMKSQGVPFNKDTFTLACGTCYKMNTPESFRLCIDLIENGQNKEPVFPRHAYYFAVALAIRQNDIEKARSFYSQIMNKESRLCQNLNVMILVIAGAILEVISFLSTAVLPKGSSFVKKVLFSQEVLDALHVLSKDGPYQMEVEHLTAQLKQAGQVSQQTLDELLCQTPKGKRKPLAAMHRRNPGRRTVKPLHYTLLSD
ncbi:pentatricopeptide repeat-containing protein 2, mitochondrial isoform X2 [Thalassophryne amazonica]|uniref:pentatricopeptide repeat-containing protein 2, mitochondrial isoform X2 n=1 Tax=Thalassophryne amazonica TaxID=390379 RepID=UPI001471F201|nr:pentatricopeptide repeat-containing protein 2, mitochondrial isoform X2 [Thalassophryne amazonica]